MLKVFKDIEQRLRDAKLHFRTESYRQDAFSLLVNEPGEYWEIDVLDDGSVDVQVFRSKGLEEDPWAAITFLVNREAEEVKKGKSISCP